MNSVAKCIRDSTNADILNPIMLYITLRVLWLDGSDAIAPHELLLHLDTPNKLEGRRLRQLERSVQSNCVPYIWNWDGLAPVMHCMISYSCYFYYPLTSDYCNDFDYEITYFEPISSVPFTYVYYDDLNGYRYLYLNGCNSPACAGTYTF